MRENKLTIVLASLSKEELLRFGKFLNSSYFNNSESSIKLYHYLKKFHPVFDNPALKKETAFNEIYPGNAYDDKKLRDRFTHLLGLLKTFLAIEKYNGNNLDFRKNLMMAYKEKKLEHMLKEELGSCSRFIEKMKFKDENYYLNKYQLEVTKRELYELKIPVSQRNELYQNVKDEIENVIHFFLIVMLKEYFIITNTMRHVNIDYKFGLFEQIITYLSHEEGNYTNIILINVFYNFFNIYKPGCEPSVIYKVKNLLVTRKEYIEEHIFKMLFIELYNNCKRRQSCGEKEFGKISFELMIDMLDLNVFLREDGRMSAHTYINLAASGLRESNLEWTENFIDKYKNQLPMEDRENAYNYNYAVLYYMKGYGKDFSTKENAYNIALAFLNKVKSDDFYYMTRIKNHALKIFYELEHFDSSFSLIDSYYHYLYRNPIIPERLRERYRNFITFLQKLIRLRLKQDMFNLEKLKLEISQNTQTEYKGWLIDKIDDLLIM